MVCPILQLKNLNRSLGDIGFGEMKQGYVERKYPHGGEWFVSGLIGLATVLICVTFMGQYGAPFGYIMGVILMISLGHLLGEHTEQTRRPRHLHQFRRRPVQDLSRHRRSALCRPAQ